MNKDCVYVVDDDCDVRKGLTRTLSQEGFEVQAYKTAREFLDNNNIEGPGCGCLILDVRMPGMSGLDLQRYLTESGRGVPIIFITGHGDIPMSVRAIKDGAFEFLEKPYNVDDLIKKIHEAIDYGRNKVSKYQEKLLVTARYEKLIAREKEVLGLLVAGSANTSNKLIAKRLDISHRTVDDHRAKIMLKMEANSITELVEMAKIAEVYSP